MVEAVSGRRADLREGVGLGGSPHPPCPRHVVWAQIEVTADPDGYIRLPAWASEHLSAGQRMFWAVEGTAQTALVNDDSANPAPATTR